MSLNGARPASPQTQPPPPQRPNVLIFLTDDQRKGLEVMDALRNRVEANGRRYPNAYVTTPVCCPSRASIMSGRYVHNHGVEANFVDFFDHRTTVQFYLQRAGYRTGYIGKFLNGWSFREGPPYFDDWALNSGQPARRYYDARVNVNGALQTIDKYSTTFFGNEAVRFLERTDRVNDPDPWLLYVAPNAPHQPFQPEKRYEDAPVSEWVGNPAVNERDLSDKPPWVRRQSVSFKRGRFARMQQYRMLESVDDMVRNVMLAVQRLDESRDTLVFFISDNGYSWGEHNLEGKFNPYLESVQVPFLAKWPQHIPPGSIDDRLVANIDIAPTIIDATGVSTEGGPEMDGRSLLDPDWERDRLLLEYKMVDNHPYPDWASTITKTSQYTEYYRGEETVYREYYDLESDPYQLLNLLGDGDLLNDPPGAPAMSLQLKRDSTCVGETCP